MPQTSKPNPDVSSLSFEQALDALRAIVDTMERGDAKLDEALAAYERGAALRKRCEQLLLEAKMKVEQISKADENGLESQDFDPAS